MSHTTQRRLAAALVALTAACAVAPRLAAQGRDDRASVLGKQVQGRLDAMAATATFLVTDKPLYHPGETIWFRAWELATKTFAPVAGDHGITFALHDPGGAKLLEKRVLVHDGLATNDFVLPAGVAGGKFVVKGTSERGATFERELTVSTYELPSVKKSVEFRKKSYGPGEDVTAVAVLEKGTGEPLAGGRVTAVVAIDGGELARFVLFANDKGKVFVRFSLPRTMKQGDGTLTLLVDAGGVTESIQRKIPILLDRVDLAAFPEGGDLVEGLPSRVYLSAKSSLGKPADVEGSVVDEQGTFVTRFSSLRGMARFELEPKKGKRYKVVLSKPAGSKQELALPVAKPSGCTLQSRDDFASSKASLAIDVTCAEARKVVATAVLRERLLASVGADVAKGATSTLQLPLEAGAQGAVRVTLFDGSAPLAERLVYRGLGKDLRVRIKADRDTYTPRDPVTLSIETTDAAGKPVAADLALAVVDDTVLSFADDKSAHLLAHLLLENEMPGQRIDEPDFYFSSDPKAPQALDLVLGTQGWRRFEWKLAAAVAR